MAGFKGHLLSAVPNIMWNKADAQAYADQGKKVTSGLPKAKRFDPTTGQLFKGENKIKITLTKGYILQNLMKNAGQVVTYSNLAESVWSEDYPDAASSLKVYI